MFSPCLPDFASSLLSPLAGICFLGKDAGDCVNYTVRWFFDHKRSVCSRFWYSGCGGNENRFATQAECERVCLSKEIKNECHERARCKKYATAWFFDTNVGACSRFWYGGCGGNANRFRTEYECFQTCGNQRKSRLGQLTGCSACCFLLKSSVVALITHSCILPQDRGSCDNYTMMWFFDAAQKECARFWYGGCGGNKNRFLTQEECQSLKPHRFIHGFIFTHTDSAGLWSSDSVRCF
uniref:BPTI/Kunitz inhibitor domain-containing protein n=1 Tax=Pundamilia nyererei TaxID=303518 RepID=A0A3B4GDE4_9CICH